MNPDVKRAWVERLRSGEVKQGAGALHNASEQRQCCLGVLSELAVEAGVVRHAMVQRTMTPAGGVQLEVTYQSVTDQADRNHKYPPEAVRRWAGLTHTDPRVKPSAEFLEQAAAQSRPVLLGGDGKVRLSSLNDSGLYSFDDIADTIERDL